MELSLDFLHSLSQDNIKRVLKERDWELVDMIYRYETMSVIQKSFARVAP
jgi:hypothetical protein